MRGFNTYYSDYCYRKSCVYRLYDPNDELLYVGMSVNPLGRLAQHRSRQPWGDEVERMTVQWFKDRETAKAAERSAIHHENPIHNLMRPQMGCC